MATTINASASSGLITTADTSTILQLQTGGTTAVTVDASQNVTLAGTLTATGVTTVPAGTVSAPAITTTGDTNTGIFFPAADTIAFAEGGVESMRIDSSGNVGIGATSPLQRLDVASSNTGVFQAIRSTSSGATNVGLRIQDGTTGTGNGDGIYLGRTGAENYLWTYENEPWVFGTNNTERARIDSSGNTSLTRSTDTSREVLSVNATAATATNQFGVNVDLRSDPNNTSNYFYAGRGNIVTDRVVLRSNGGIANFSANNVNLSDRREKTNFAPAGDYLAKICAIPVQTFNYIDQNMEEDGGLTLGVVAQDVQAVAPELVTESNWGTAEEPKMRLSIYQTDLQYALMKCIQEQQALITQLQADVAALKGAST
jgi:hypothetical protein